MGDQSRFTGQRQYAVAGDASGRKWALLPLYWPGERALLNDGGCNNGEQALRCPSTMVVGVVGDDAAAVWSLAGSGHPNLLQLQRPLQTPSHSCLGFILFFSTSIVVFFFLVSLQL